MTKEQKYEQKRRAELGLSPVRKARNNRLIDDDLSRESNPIGACLVSIIVIGIVVILAAIFLT